uniref:MCAfunc domain-containing protein n=1 Tax=Leersia perrieri TaxID=77586 RepID=A0A0D9XV78_9ORYZ
MEAGLSMVNSVVTIVKLANDIAGAVKTVRQNKKSCEKFAERVADIGEILKELGDASSPSTVAAAATKRLVIRLEKALGRALLLVRSCQNLVAGGCLADEINEVNVEIDRCLLDIGVASLVLVSRIDRKVNAAAGDVFQTPPQCSHGHDDDEEKNGVLVCYGGEQSGKYKTAAGDGEVTTVVGVPPPPPYHGHGCYYLHCHCTHGHYCQFAGGGHGHYLSTSYPCYYSDSNVDALSMVSNVTTVIKLSIDITMAVKKVSRNKKSCEKLAERVAVIGETLKKLETSSPSTAAAAATERLVIRLEKALRRALPIVQSCQASSRIYSMVAGGWQADQLDEVNVEIDRCLLDLSLSTLALVTDIDRKLNAEVVDDDGSKFQTAPPSPTRCIHGHDDDDTDDEMASAAADGDVADDEKNGEQDNGKTKMDDDVAIAGEVVTAVGVPAVWRQYYYQPPPPCNGYHQLHCHCTHGHCHCTAGAGYDYYMFSDDNPHSCTIM